MKKKKKLLSYGSAFPVGRSYYWSVLSIPVAHWISNEHSSSPDLLLVQKVRYSQSARQKAQTCSDLARPARQCQQCLGFLDIFIFFPPRNSLQSELEDFLHLCNSSGTEEGHQKFLARPIACAVGNGQQAWNPHVLLGFTACGEISCATCLL